MSFKKGNITNLVNGTRISRLTLGTMPAELRVPCRRATQYRTELENQLIQVKGEVSFTDAHLVDEAATAEVHAAVCRWLLRERIKDMSSQDIQKCSESLMKAKDKRNRAVEKLGLDKPKEDVIDVLYG